LEFDIVFLLDAWSAARAGKNRDFPSRLNQVPGVNAGPRRFQTGGRVVWHLVASDDVVKTGQTWKSKTLAT
jgi:hypothetical protein